MGHHCSCSQCDARTYPLQSGCHARGLSRKANGRGNCALYFSVGCLRTSDLVNRSNGCSILPKEEFTGIPLKEARFRSHFGVAVIGIQRKKQSVDDRGEIQVEMEIATVPGPDEIISSDDILVVVGDRFQIKQIARKD